MGKLLCDSSAASVETLAPATPPSGSPLHWAPPPPPPSTTGYGWGEVAGLEDQQRRKLERISDRGVAWKVPDPDPVSSSDLENDREAIYQIFRLEHGGEVESDGNCLFTATRRSMCVKMSARELRRCTVRRFQEEYEKEENKEGIDLAIRNMYSPDLKAGWGVHVVQEVKLLARKEDRVGMDSAINELMELGIQREIAAETIYKERCIAVNDGSGWAKYMSISGSDEDEHDIITLQYTEEGLISIDENRDGHAAAFGDDIALECLATEFKREVYVVQAHGSDAMVDEDNCVFFLPHCPRGPICGAPIFLFMKGTGWCGAGADHYEPLITSLIPNVSHDKAAIVL
ncbi:hypothetical protein LUZ61_012534 [Rhynchospora tenuis]|uniref:OTU domain-containing protein n=1 Tax=Rhynchospora tenuis TaxID=198213 RepID=A0AAD6A325_9POAL|nr:hypothetical protein LUZ61_012534 [Rhynchospora tenuis]